MVEQKTYKKLINFNCLLRRVLGGNNISLLRLVIFIFLLNPFQSNAQDPLKHFNAENGLLSSETYQVFQDSKGYIWVATDEGVSRYDGYEFKHYNTSDGLFENTVLEIYEDYKQRLWFIPITNELCYLQNDTIYPYAYNDSIKKYNIVNEYPIKRSFYVDSSDNLYFGIYRNDIFKINKAGFVTFMKYKGELTNKLYKVENEYVFTSTKDAGSRYAEIENPFQPDSIVTLNFPRSINRSFVCQYKDKVLYSFNNTITVFNPDGSYNTFDLKKEIFWISVDNYDRICVGFFKGGVKLYSSTNFDKYDHHFLANNSVTSVVNDSEDGYWISTIENGVYLFPSLNIKAIKEYKGYSFSPLTEIETYKNEVYFAGVGNFYSTVDENRIVNNYQINNNLPDSAITTLLKFNDDRLFISYKSNGLYVKDDNRIKTLYKFGHYTLYNRIKNVDLFYFLKNIILFVENKEVPTLHIKRNQYNQVYESIQINDSVSWLATDQGLMEFTLFLSRYLVKRNWLITKRDRCYVRPQVEEINNGKSIIKNNYTIKHVSNDPLLNRRIRSISRDSYGNYWFGTSNSGIVRYNEKSIKYFQGENKFEDVAINKIKSLDTLLIISTANGIFAIPQIADSLDISNAINYSTGIGLISNEINDFDILNNEIYLATNKGLSIIPIHLNVYKSPLFVYNVMINDKDTVIANSYNLPYDKNYIELFFKSLNYQRQDDITYQYKLEGMENSWRKTTSQSVKYSNLAPGEYRFLLKSENSLGVETILDQPISILINKPFYKTVWFILLMVIAGLLIVFIIFLIVLRFRLKEASKRYSVEQELNRSRQQALSAQMNPHFIYNSLNSVQSYILKNERVKASEYLSKLGRLMRDILNNSQNQTITLREEFDALEKYMEMEQLRFKDVFKYKLNVCSKIDLDKIHVPPLIIQPFVENAIHHGLRLRKEGGELLVDASIIDNALQIMIQDNGVGIENAKQYNSKTRKNHKSFGTEITNKRLKLLEETNNEKVEILVSDVNSDDEFPGTKVMLTIGIKYTNE